MVAVAPSDALREEDPARTRPSPSLKQQQAPRQRAPSPRSIAVRAATHGRKACALLPMLAVENLRANRDQHLLALERHHRTCERCTLHKSAGAGARRFKLLSTHQTATTTPLVQQSLPSFSTCTSSSRPAVIPDARCSASSLSYPSRHARLPAQSSTLRSASCDVAREARAAEVSSTSAECMISGACGEGACSSHLRDSSAPLNAPA